MTKHDVSEAERRWQDLRAAILARQADHTLAADIAVARAERALVEAMERMDGR